MRGGERSWFGFRKVSRKEACGRGKRLGRGSLQVGKVGTCVVWSGKSIHSSRRRKRKRLSNSRRTKMRTKRSWKKKRKEKDKR